LSKVTEGLNSDKNRGQRTEDRGQKTEDRGQKTEDRRQNSVCCLLTAVLTTDFTDYAEFFYLNLIGVNAC